MGSESYKRPEYANFTQGQGNPVHYCGQNYHRLMLGCPTGKKKLRNHRKAAKNRAKKTGLTEKTLPFFG